MSERMTAIHLLGTTRPGIADWGMKTAPEMIEQYRSYARNLLEEAQAVLAASDEEFMVESYRGPWAMRDRKIIQQGRQQTK